MFNNIYDVLMDINNMIWVLLVPVLLLAGTFFTLRTNFTQIKNLPEMFRTLKFSSSSNNGISGIQAFFIGLASRVGTGNIAGVASAIMIGGPGSVFWMWIVALLGAASAFIESTLAQLFKVEDEETKFRGGPAYYISRGLKNNKLAITFAISLSIAFGLILVAVQSNTISNSFEIFFNQSSPIIAPIANSVATPLSISIAIILSILVLKILFSNTQIIAKLSEVLVPVMALIYVILALFALMINFTLIPDLFVLIISSAFSPEALAGGLSGSVIQQGVKRGLFSNEAGMGSAPNSAASADVEHPVTQGFIQSLGVFVDTLIVCSTTAFIVLLPTLKESTSLSQTYSGINDGIIITQTALLELLGTGAVYILTVAVVLFAFTSILGNYFYSQANIEFLSTRKDILRVYKILVVFMVVFGSIVNASVVWNLADLFIGIMALINIYAIVSLHRYAILLLKDYKEQKKLTNIPIFNASKYTEFDEFEIWKKDNV